MNGPAFAPMAAPSPAAPADWNDAVVELRQYTLHPGMRDTLVELFEREFIESQEAVGMHVIGQFHDLDRADRFVWLRGFESMEVRERALGAFYGGPVWQRHRDAANATMIDSDDVLLLRPVAPDTGFAAAVARPARTGAGVPRGALVAGICRLARPADQGFAALFEQRLAPLLLRNGVGLRARYMTEAARNTFPRLPVREGEQVFVWFAGFDSDAAQIEHLAALARDPEWRVALDDARARDLLAPPGWLRLRPTPRSEQR